MPDDSRNLGKEFNERHSPNKLEFITDRYHVLREIYRKFGRVSSVKRISLYLKSRARPAENSLQNFTDNTTQVGLQTTEFARPRSISKAQIQNTNSHHISTIKTY